MELHHDVVEHILEKLPIKSLLRFKLVSVQWNFIIESQYFKKKNLIYRQSQDPDILILYPREYNDDHPIRILTMSSSDLIKLPILFPPCKKTHFENYPLLRVYRYSVSGSCDGMLCYYNHANCIYVVNPVTRWFRNVPQARYQAVVLDTLNRERWKFMNDHAQLCSLGFGKDKFTGTYKLVWLYNSFEISLENTTTCEVFDFSTNTWKYVTAAPCRILNHHIPVHLDGSLHWFTDESIGETRILSFNFHTETFHIVLKTPFPEAPSSYSKNIVMCNLNDRLSVSQKEWLRQEIWSLNNSDMIWEKIYSLNLDPQLFRNFPPTALIPNAILCVTPVTVLKKTKSLVLFDTLTHVGNRKFTIYDPELRSYDACSHNERYAGHYSTVVPFTPSLISIVEE